MLEQKIDFSYFALVQRLQKAAAVGGVRLLFLNMSDIASSLTRALRNTQNLHKFAEIFFEGFPDKEKIIRVMESYSSRGGFEDVIKNAGRILYRCKDLEAFMAFIDVMEQGKDGKGVYAARNLGNSARKCDPEIIKAEARRYLDKWNSGGDFKQAAHY